MYKKLENMSFSEEKLKLIQNFFHELIIDRAKEGWNCKDFLNCENKNLPIISNDMKNYDTWFPVPGMYGGFTYVLLERNDEPVLISESWSRIVQGSGQRHEITEKGYILVEDEIV